MDPEILDLADFLTEIKCCANRAPLPPRASPALGTAPAAGSGRRILLAAPTLTLRPHGSPGPPGRLGAHQPLFCLPPGQLSLQLFAILDRILHNFTP